MSTAISVALIKRDILIIYEKELSTKIFETTTITPKVILTSLLKEKTLLTTLTTMKSINTNIDVLNGIEDAKNSPAFKNLMTLYIFHKPFIPLMNDSFEPAVDITKDFLKKQYYSDKEPIINSIKEKFNVSTEIAVSMFIPLLDKLTTSTIELLQIGTLIKYLQETYDKQWLDCVA